MEGKKDRVIFISPEVLIAGTMRAKNSKKVSIDDIMENKEYVYKKYNEKGELSTTIWSSRALAEVNRKYNYPFNIDDDSIELKQGYEMQFLDKKILRYCSQEVYSWILAKEKEKTSLDK